MGVKRKRYTFRGGDIIDVEEHHDGAYGAPGKKREKRGRPTPEQMQAENEEIKRRRCRHKLLEYFSAGDTFCTLTYAVDKRPADMGAALRDFRKMIGKVRAEYRKRGRELYWIRNIERGTKGAWHIHMAINEIGETAAILQRHWKGGGVWVTTIRQDAKIYDEDFTKLAAYLTKSEKTVTRKADGEKEKPRLKEASYSSSRNMPIKEPKVDKLQRWKAEPKPKKGYYIARIHEGVNPITGYLYRRYTMIKLDRRI